MIERWSKPLERIARAAPTETGGGDAPPESASTPKLSVTEWLAKIKEGQTPEAGPDKPKGAKEKRAFSEYMRELGISQGVGVYKPHSATEFEIALSAYANARLRVGKELARLGALAELDGRDMEGFNRVAEKIDEKLMQLNIAAPELPEPPETPPAPEQKPEPAAPAPADVQRESAPAEAPANPLELVAVPPLARPAARQNFTGAETDEDVVADQRRRGAANPAVATGVIDEDVVRARKAGSKAGGRAGKEKKKKGIPTKMEHVTAVPAVSESAEERDVRVGAALAFFDERVGRGASPTLMFQLSGMSLPKKDRALFTEQVEQQYDLNGTKITDVPDLSALGNTVDEIRSVLGVQESSVGRIPYWLLPGGDAVILDKSEKESEQAILLRVQPGGNHRFPFGWHRFENGEFRRLSKEEVDTAFSKRDEALAASRAAGFATEPRRERTATRSRTGDAVREEDELREDTGQLDKKSTRTLREALVLFTRRRHTEKANLEAAFSDAAEGLSIRNRRLLADDAVKSGESPALIESILRHIRKREEQGAQERGSGYGTDRSRRIDRQAEEIFESRRPASEQPRRESAREKQRRELQQRINEQADKIFGSD